MQASLWQSNFDNTDSYKANNSTIQKVAAHKAETCVSAECQREVSLGLKFLPLSVPRVSYARLALRMRSARYVFNAGLCMYKGMNNEEGVVGGPSCGGSVGLHDV